MSKAEAIQLKMENQTAYFKCPEFFEVMDIENITRGLLGLDRNQVKELVFDFQNTKELTPSFISLVSQYSKTLHGSPCKIKSLNVNTEIKRQIFSLGVSGVFNLVNMDSASAKKSAVEEKKAYKLDIELINPFVEGVMQTFEKQVQVKVTPSKPQLKDRSKPVPVEIAGIISLQSNGFNFSLALCFTADVFLKLYESMVGEKHDKITADLEDAAGEILNMVYGFAKTILNEKGYSLEKAIPTVMTGEKLNLISTGTQPTIQLVFSSSIGNFYLEINVDKK